MGETTAQRLARQGHRVAGYPIPRLGGPEKGAAACCFLASEDAGYIPRQAPGVNEGTAM